MASKTYQVEINGKKSADVTTELDDDAERADHDRIAVDKARAAFEASEAAQAGGKFDIKITVGTRVVSEFSVEHPVPPPAEDDEEADA